MTKAHLGWWAGERYWQCTEHVFSGERCDMRGHQCGKTATKDPDADGNPTKCGIHSAEGKAKKAAKRADKWQEYKAKADRANLERVLSIEARNIVRLIADGHNDARGLCADWIARWDADA
jgi:hypothetical protein